MRAKLLFLALLICAGSIWSQNWVTKTRPLLPSTDELTSLDKYKVTKTDVLLYEDSTKVLDEIIVSFFAKHRIDSKTKIKRSSLLDVLSREMNVGINLKKSYKKEKHQSVLRKIMKAVLGIQRSYGLIEYSTFDIVLVQTPKTYFYDETVGTSPYHLYKGKKPKASELEAGTYVYKPCKIQNEQELMRRIEFKIRSSRIYNLLTKKQVQVIGLSIIPIQRTVHRKGQPTVRVVLLAGVKRIDTQKLTSGKYRSAIRKNKRFYEKELKNVRKFLIRT